MATGLLDDGCLRLDAALFHAYSSSTSSRISSCKFGGFIQKAKMAQKPLPSRIPCLTRALELPRRLFPTWKSGDRARVKK